jgi:hypothetical protein
MKMRIHSNSLRLRLDRSEVARLGKGGRVEERLALSPSDGLVYAVEAASDAAALEVRWERGGITVRIPRAVARRWAGTEQVGIKGEQDAGGSSPLCILVEKDFPCLHHGEPGDAPERFGELAGERP